MTTVWFFLLCTGYQEMICQPAQTFQSKRECEFISKHYNAMIRSSDSTIRVSRKCVSISRNGGNA